MSRPSSHEAAPARPGVEVPGTTVTLRPVERFAEPQFSELVQRLLHDPDRRVVSERFLGVPAIASAVAPAAATARQVRIGAFAGEALVGWSHAYVHHGAALYVASSAVVPEFRRQGIYTRLIAAMEAEALALGCLRVESHHQAANSAVLIAKLKAGYTIVGTEFAAETGLLVKMSRPLEPRWQALFGARSGTLEAAARFFGATDAD